MEERVNMKYPFLTGMAVGAFLVAALTVWWYYYRGGDKVDDWVWVIRGKIERWFR